MRKNKHIMVQNQFLEVVMFYEKIQKYFHLQENFKLLIISTKEKLLRKKL